MKRVVVCGDRGPHAVAPRAGAWIEAAYTPAATEIVTSLPVRERGLKPSAGARSSTRAQVAPRAGAWIEAKVGGFSWACPGRSLPVRERGLKLAQDRGALN